MENTGDQSKPKEEQETATAHAETANTSATVRSIVTSTSQGLQTLDSLLRELEMTLDTIPSSSPMDKEQ